MSKRFVVILIIVIFAFVALARIFGEMNGHTLTASAHATNSLVPFGSNPFTTTWIIETVDSSGGIGDSSLAMASNDQPHISYYDNSNGDLKYVRWNGFSWLTETVDNVGDVGWSNSLALDSNGRPHISYYDSTNGDLKYVRWDGFSWLTETVDNVGDVGLYTSLALDSNDYSHISYYDSTNADLKYAQWDGLSWLTETIDSVGDVGRSSSIALDSNGYAHISYYSSNELKYARWDGFSWEITTIDNVSGGNFTSLALDSNDHAHISYHDEANFDLKYAQWNGSSWEIEIVDSGGSDGLASLALTSDDYAHISYDAALTPDLKYAHIESIAYIEPAIGGQLIVPEYVAISVPANTFTDSIKLVYTALQSQSDQPHVDVFFELSAVYSNTGLPAQLAPGQTISAVIQYDQNNVPLGMCETRMSLFGWIGKLLVWQPIPSIVDTNGNIVMAEIDRLGVNAILGEYCLHLPSIMR